MAADQIETAASYCRERDEWGNCGWPCRHLRKSQGLARPGDAGVRFCCFLRVVSPAERRQRNQWKRRLMDGVALARNGLPQQLGRKRKLEPAGGWQRRLPDGLPSDGDDAVAGRKEDVHRQRALGRPVHNGSAFTFTFTFASCGRWSGPWLVQAAPIYGRRCLRSLLKRKPSRNRRTPKRHRLPSP